MCDEEKAVIKEEKNSKEKAMIPAGVTAGNVEEKSLKDDDKDFAELWGRKPFHAYESAAIEFGTDAANFARHLAEADFAKFKAGMRSIGFPTLYDDEPDGMRGRSPLWSYKMPRLANAALCMRYPFLVPRSRWTGDVIWYDEIDEAMYDETRVSIGGRTAMFGSTELDAMPIGWLARFGLEVCEDIKTVLEGTEAIDNPMDYYRIEQIKEKWGSLRWYSGGVPRDTYEDELKVIDLYELISTRTCIGCGGHDRIRVSGGWVSYECFRCRSERRDGISDDALLSRYNELAESGRLVEIVSAQSDEWKERVFGEKPIPDAYEPAKATWSIPWAIRDLVEKDILDAGSYPVNTIESSRNRVTYEFLPSQRKPVRHEVDLIAWADEKGLLAADLARSVDAMRRAFDGDTNLPDPKDEEPDDSGRLDGWDDEVAEEENAIGEDERDAKTPTNG